MSYGIELKTIPLADYRNMLKVKELLPGRRMLHENIDGNFNLLIGAGFSDAEALYKALGSPQKLEAVCAKTGISAEYLTLLKRELGGLVAKTVPLEQFPELNASLVSLLKSKGIKSSKDLYEATKGFKNPEKLCELVGVLNEHALEVCALCDFVRVNGVGTLFAHILYAAGYTSVKDIASDNAEHLRSSVNSVIAARYSIENLGTKDAQYCIDYAALLMKHSG